MLSWIKDEAKVFVVVVMISTLLSLFMFYSVYQKIVYLKLLPSIKLKGYILNIERGQDGEGNYLTYSITYRYNNKNYLVRSNARPGIDKLKLNKGDTTEVLVSKINPNIGAPTHGLDFILGYFVLFILLILNIASFKILIKNNFWSEVSD